MPDVSAPNSLKSPLTINPYFQTAIDCISRATNEYGGIENLKGKKHIVHDLVFESNLLSDLYNDIEPEELDSFKKALARIFHCGLSGTALITPYHSLVSHIMCKNKGCLHCAAYKAMERLRYPRDIIRYAIFEDEPQSLSVMREIESLIKEGVFPYFTVVSTPIWSGGYMIRLSNLRQDEMNPLIEENEVKKSVAMFDEIYTYFDTANDITRPGSIEQVYISGSGIRFTTTELYQIKCEGRDAEREKGTPSGYEFNPNLNEITFISKKDYKKKQEEKDELEGIVGKVNMPNVSLSGTSYETSHNTLMAALRSNSDHADTPVYSISGLADLKHVTVNIANSWRDNLAQAGHPQPEIYSVSKITEKHIKEFNDRLGIPPIKLLPNITELEFTDADLGKNGRPHGFLAQLEVRRNVAMQIAKEKILNGMEFRDLATKILKDAHRNPPE